MWRETFNNTPWYFRALGTLIVLVCLIGFVEIARGGPRVIALAWARLYEDAAYLVSPSAERASQYGEWHFSSSRSMMYDIDRAEYFYDKAAVLDPQYPYVHHQLARIAFLRGNFNTAMMYIDKEIKAHGDEEPNTYYIRGLIEGYMGRYEDSARDYAHFLEADPHNWATMNDLAWVLLKAERFQDAVEITKRGLEDFPDNPWLLNSHATALFELHDLHGALDAAKKASIAVADLSEKEWLHAYPGNDPKIAGQGIVSFKKAVADNVHTIEAAVASSTVH